MSVILANSVPSAQAEDPDIDFAFEDYLNLDECDDTGTIYPEPEPLPVDIFDNAFVSANYIDAEGFDKSILTKGPNLIYADVVGDGSDLCFPCTLENYFDMDAMEKELTDFKAPTNLYHALSEDYDARHELPDGMFDNPPSHAIKVHNLSSPVFGKEVRHKFALICPNNETTMGLNWNTSWWTAPALSPEEADRGAVGVIPQKVSSIAPVNNVSGDVPMFPSIFNRNVDMDDDKDDELTDVGIIAPWDRMPVDETSEAEYDCVHDEYNNCLMPIRRPRFPSDTASDSDSDSESDTDSFRCRSLNPPRVIVPLPSSMRLCTSYSSPRCNSSLSLRSGLSDAGVDSEYVSTPGRAVKRKARRTLAPKTAKRPKPVPKPFRNATRKPKPSVSSKKSVCPSKSCTPPTGAVVRESMVRNAGPTTKIAQTLCTSRARTTTTLQAAPPSKQAVALKVVTSPESTSGPQIDISTPLTDSVVDIATPISVTVGPSKIPSVGAPARRVSAEGSHNKKFHCPSDNCTQICNSAGDLRRHLESRAHQAPSYPCLACGQQYTRIDALRRHHRNGAGCKRTHAALEAAERARDDVEDDR